VEVKMTDTVETAIITGAATVAAGILTVAGLMWAHWREANSARLTSDRSWKSNSSCVLRRLKPLHGSPQSETPPNGKRLA
jgi:hypothetical protein